MKGGLSDTPLHARARAKPRRKRQMVMTHKRRLVLAALIEVRQRGERVTLAEIARRTGLHDYRDARRIVRDLEAMGHSLRDVLVLFPYCGQAPLS